jgi:quinoprotein glucose dehydrogenase
VVFVAATLDHAIRAFDVETGRKLWEAPLPAGARATPMTYQVTPAGKQYVVICVGGGDEFGKGDFVIAFALP